MKKLKDWFNNLSKKQKIIVIVVVFLVCGLITLIDQLTKGPAVEGVSIKETTINLYKEDSKKIKLNITPSDAEIDDISFNGYDNKIINIDSDKKKITAKNEGKTSFICQVTDTHGNVVESKKVTVNVNLTESQLEVKRNTLTTTEKGYAITLCKDAIKKCLKSPSSAKFEKGYNWDMRKVNNVISIWSHVDADNSFGANIRTNFTVQITMNDDGNGTVTYLQLGDETVGTYQ